jgi:hypothetical protein
MKPIEASMSRASLVFLVSLLGAVCAFLNPRPSLPTDGLQAEGPVQSALEDERPFEHGEFTLTPRASYDLRARVLSVNRHRLGFFREARLSPIDLFVGWERMSDPSIYSQISITHGRTYWIGWGSEGPPIAEDEIWESHSNNHLIPASAAIRRQLSRLRPGQLVQLVGLLVDVSAPDGYSWGTSLTRTDRGVGNCELLFVQRVELTGPR